MMQAPVISDVLQHTGDEPVQPGVYNPIHSRPLLPHERQRHHNQRIARPTSSSGLLPSVAGRETADGSIDVEDVDPAPYTEATSRMMSRRMPNTIHPLHERDQRLLSSLFIHGLARHNDNEYDEDEDDDEDEDYDYGDDDEEQDGSGNASVDEYGRTLPIALPSHAHVVFPRTGQPAVDMFFRDMSRHTGGPLRTSSNRQSSRGQRTRDNSSRRRNGGQHPMYPFHPGLLQHHYRRSGSGRISPFDFFHGEDIGDLLAFIDANAPVTPVAPPQPPLPPLRLTKQQQELAKTGSYTRTVPDANFRDAPRDATAALLSAETVEIICTLCEGTLCEKEP
ncbi:hypothetical protein J3B02_006190, partial [Coemansia erecta]